MIALVIVACVALKESSPEPGFESEGKACTFWDGVRIELSSPLPVSVNYVDISKALFLRRFRTPLRAEFAANYVPTTILSDHIWFYWFIDLGIFTLQTGTLAL